MKTKRETKEQTRLSRVESAFFTLFPNERNILQEKILSLKSIDQAEGEQAR